MSSMRIDLKALCLAAVLIGAAASARAQTTMLPFDHIHVNEPAAEASLWWEKNIPADAASRKRRTASCTAPCG